MSKLSQSDDSLELLDAIEIGIELREYPHQDESASGEEGKPRKRREFNSVKLGNALRNHIT